MPRGTYLSDIEKGKILALIHEGVSKREIARRIGRSDCVVRNFFKDTTNYGKNKTGGPKSKISDRSQRRIISSASNSMKTAREIADECGQSVSRWTIHRVLKKSKVITRQKLQPAPRLLSRHIVDRLDFARINMARDWKNVQKISKTYLDNRVFNFNYFNFTDYFF